MTKMEYSDERLMGDGDASISVEIESVNMFKLKLNHEVVHVE